MLTEDNKKIHDNNCGIKREDRKFVQRRKLKINPSNQTYKNADAEEGLTLPVQHTPTAGDGVHKRK
jgi:hypothetical protein